MMEIVLLMLSSVGIISALCGVEINQNEFQYGWQWARIPLQHAILHLDITLHVQT